MIESHYDRNPASSANKRQRTRNQHRGNAAKGRERQAAADVRRHSATVSRANKRQRKDGSQNCFVADVRSHSALGTVIPTPSAECLGVAACWHSLELRRRLHTAQQRFVSEQKGRENKAVSTPHYLAKSTPWERCLGKKSFFFLVHVGSSRRVAPLSRHCADVRGQRSESAEDRKLFGHSHCT